MRKIIVALLLAIGLSSPALAAPCGPIPALPDTVRRTEYTGIVAQTGPFNVGFQLYGDSTDYGAWLSVWVNGVAKTAGVDYTVAPASGPAFGTACLPIQNAQVTFTVAQTGTIEIEGARRPRRASQVSENAGVSAHALNQVISDITATLRERWDREPRLLRVPPGDTLSVLPLAAARAGNFLIFDGAGNPALTSPTPGLGNVLGTNPSKIGNVAAWNNTGGTLLNDGGVLATSIIKSIEDFGASPANTGAQNLTAIQAAINATPAGGTLKILKPGYNVAGTLIINKNMKLVCANADPTVAANLIENTATANLLAIRSGYVTVDTCSLAMSGSPSGSASGFIIGDDAIQKVSGGAFVNTSTTLTCSTCSFTSADIGKGIYAAGVGAAGGNLFTTIASITDGTHVVMANAAGASNATATFAYGNNYQEIVLRDVQSYNFITGINIVAAAQYHVDHAYVLGANPMTIQNILWGDNGDGEIGRSTFIASVAGTNYTVDYHSGGLLRFHDNKVLAQASISACFRIFWDYTTSVGPIFHGNSIEGGCTHGIEVSGTTALSGGEFVGGEIGVTGTAFFVAPTAPWSNWSASGIQARMGSGNTAFDISASNNYVLNGNVVENLDGVASTAYVIRATAANGVVRPGAVSSTSATITNLSSTTLIDDQRGMAFASLPTVAANGSRIFVTDGTPNSTPCTGSSTGATAFRQNGVWACGTAITIPLPVNQGGTGAITLNNHSILLGQGTAAVGAIGAMTDGQIVVGQTGADPLQKTLSGAGTLSAAGALTINLGAGATVTGSLPNANLANSSVTIGTTSIALGATSLTLAGVTSYNKVAITAPATGATLKLLDGGTNAFDQTANIYFGVTSGSFSLNASALGLFSKNNSTNGNGVHVESSNTIFEFFAGNLAAYLSSPGNVPLNFFLNGGQVGQLSSTGALSTLSNHTAMSATAPPAGGVAGYLFSSTAGFGVFFGSGVPTISAAQGSIYLRTDGSSTSTRIYVNTNGSTGWTNVTTAT